jgi:hypothetical protein
MTNKQIEAIMQENNLSSDQWDSLSDTARRIIFRQWRVIRRLAKESLFWQKKHRAFCNMF